MSPPLSLVAVSAVAVRNRHAAEREERRQKRPRGATHGDPPAARIRLSGSARRRGGDALASSHARREVPAE